ncbi:MAG: tRNA lysidine(34) synthetase TilS [Alphaproteobacteria bacterium]|nr:tRNA lysidine(34) synthetase TilS [Alphaproteobacteria bacterium]
MVAKPLLQDECAALLEHFDLQEQSIAVAVSGGPDSMALAYLLARVSSRPVQALIVDHGLRPESKKEAQQVKNWLSQWSNIKPYILRWDGPKPSRKIMEAARAARYELLARKCRALKIRNLLLAHHQDDQAETFLFRLAKGSGLDGLAAMKPVQPYDDLMLVRPFLSIPKARLEATCANFKIPFVRDPSNENPAFARPRLRASADVLAAEGLTSKRLALTAQRLSRASQALESMTEKYFAQTVLIRDQNRIVLDFSKLEILPEEIALRILITSSCCLNPEAGRKIGLERFENLLNDLFHLRPFRCRTLGKLIFALKKEKAGVTLRIDREEN